MWYYLREMWRSSWFLRLASVVAGVALVVWIVTSAGSPAGRPAGPSLPSVPGKWADPAGNLGDKAGAVADQALDVTADALDVAETVVETGGETVSAGADVLKQLLGDSTGRPKNNSPVRQGDSPLFPAGTSGQSPSHFPAAPNRPPRPEPAAPEGTTDPAAPSGSP